MTTAREAISTAVSLDARPDPEAPAPVGSWVRAVGNYARCDNKHCTTRVRGSLALYRTIHNDGTAYAYATQLCVPCKLQEMADTFVALGMQPEPDPPKPLRDMGGKVIKDKGGKPKLAELADPDWRDPRTRKAVDGVLLDRMQFEHLNRLVLRELNKAPAGEGVPDQRGVELVSVDKREAREKRKAKAEPREELSGKRADLGA